MLNEPLWFLLVIVNIDLNIFIADSFSVQVPNYERECENNKGEHKKRHSLVLRHEPLSVDV